MWWWPQETLWSKTSEQMFAKRCGGQRTSLRPPSETLEKIVIANGLTLHKLIWKNLSDHRWYICIDAICQTSHDKIVHRNSMSKSNWNVFRWKQEDDRLKEFQVLHLDNPSRTKFEPCHHLRFVASAIPGSYLCLHQKLNSSLVSQGRKKMHEHENLYHLFKFCCIIIITAFIISSCPFMNGKEFARILRPNEQRALLSHPRLRNKPLKWMTDFTQAGTLNEDFQVQDKLGFIIINHHNFTRTSKLSFIIRFKTL